MDPFDLKNRYPITGEDVKAAWRNQVRWQI
jgi:uncharacterized protein (DUF433 family)